MGFNVNGYVLEPPRVGAANSPYTLTPADFLSNPTAFNSYYTSAENVSRTDYLTLVLVDGKLADAQFGWTKNEGLVVGGPAVQRFDYDTKHQRFFPLPGGAPETVGVLGLDSNTNRLKVSHVPLGVMAAAPFRISVGTTGSGVTFSVNLVTSFGSPAVGQVELLTQGSNAGQLNWNTADLTTYNGQTVRFQRQVPFTLQESNGNIGPIGNNTLLLAPIPGDTQYPLIRIGYGLYLQAVEKLTESSFSVDPAPGTVEWALSTGLLKFNSSDISNNVGRAVYYDGILIQSGLSLPRQSLGTVNLASNVSPQSVTIASLPIPDGGDIIFRVPGVIQFEQAVSTAAADFDVVGKQGQVQYDPNTGQVILSLADRTSYGGQSLEVVFGDLPIERGVSMRFFRTPIDLAGTDPTIKDVTSIYQITGATWASPIIGMPFVFMPSTPIDSGSYPTTVTIGQGTGTFVGTLSRLDVPSPPAGIGYVINYDSGQLQFAQRNNDQLVTLSKATPIAVLPNPLVFDSQLDFALETSPGSNVYTPFTESPPGSGVFTSSSGLGGLLDATAGQFSFTQIAGNLIASGSAGAFNGTSFSDTGTDFSVAGVQTGDLLVVLSGAAKGIYTIASVSGNTLTTDLVGVTSANLEYEIHRSDEVLADRFFQLVSLTDPNTKVERIRVLGPISNSPRLTVPLQYVNAVRFRYGDGASGTFSQVVNVVANDGAFTSPALLPQGTVEVSAATGDLNFAQADVTAGSTVYWARKLTSGVDYIMTASLGNIYFTDRFLAQEEGLITYASQNNPDVLIVERMTFLVRKEITQPHPIPTSTLSFNPLGRPVAATPSPAVFRGGRPQVIGQQCTVNTTNSTVTFLPDTILSNALPHGATVNPIENVYIDYYVYEAIGGEKTVNVLNPPINLAQVVITSGTGSFTVSGDVSASFPAGFLMRIGTEQVYQIGSATYNASTKLTTVTLGGNEVFTDDFQNPPIYVASGATRTSSVLFFPSYFSTELAAYDPVARGMNNVKLLGDRTSSYRAGSILLFVSGSNLDFYQATGVSYDATSNRTTVTLSRNVVQQYDSQVLKFSVRPIYESTTTRVTTTYNPVLTRPYLVWRRVEGGIGQILQSPTDYTIDQNGTINFSSPLQKNEQLAIFYSGYYSVQAGLRLKASYTNVITANDVNGLLNQVLLVDYSIFSPDSFYYRVETMTNFRNEYATELQQQAQQAAPTSGPMTSNTSSPELFQQGRASVYFNEGHYANQDIIARSTLKFYNDAINDLEDVLHAIDGRVVGDSSGRFKFDGNVNNPPRTTFSSVTNQIDDLLKVSAFPSPGGTYQQVYLAGPFSRFFKTRRNLFVGPIGSGPFNDGDVIGKFPFTNLSSVPKYIFKRWPRAQILFDYPAGTTTFEVDNANGTTDALLRPAFVPNMRVVIQDSNGTFYLNDAAHVEVLSVGAGPETITLKAPVGVTVPKGATIYMAPSDANNTLNSSQNGYEMLYQVGLDVNVTLETGELDFVTRKFPNDGSLAPIWPTINEVQPGDILQANAVGLFNTDVAPYKFPALEGKTYNDDGDQAIPLIGPTFDGEMTPTGGGPLNDESAALTLLGTTTAATFSGTGTLSGGGLTITLSSGTFPVTPKQYDLVRILTGVNAGSTYRHVDVGATTTTLSVVAGEAFSADPNPFTFELVTTASSLSHVATGSVTSTTLTDLTALFTTDGTQVGFTVVVTTGLNAKFRRQVVAIVDNNHLTLDNAFPSNDTGFSYRIDNTLDTYSGPVMTSIESAVASELTAVQTNEDTAISNFLTTIFTTVLPPSATGSVSGTSLTDGSVDFLASGVTTSELVYVPSGANRGVYQISAVPSAHTITTGQSFPSAGAVSYEIVSAFGVGFTTLTNIFGILTQNDAFVTVTLTWQSIITTPVAVANDAQAYARSILASDVSARITTVSGRLSYLVDPSAGPVALLQAALAGTERLYDKRYTWIDARINLQKGLLVLEQRAVSDRIAQQADVLNQLIKLEAVQQ